MSWFVLAFGFAMGAVFVVALLMTMHEKLRLNRCLVMALLRSSPMSGRDLVAAGVSRGAVYAVLASLEDDLVIRRVSVPSRAGGAATETVYMLRGEK